MKCYFHPEVDAVGVCTSCGKGLCSSCKLELVGKLYCQSCADRLVTGATESPTSEVSAWYFLLPFLFGFLGGLAAYYVDDNYKKDKNRAKNMLLTGITITVFSLGIFFTFSWLI